MTHGWEPPPFTPRGIYKDTVGNLLLSITSVTNPHCCHFDRYGLYFCSKKLMWKSVFDVRLFSMKDQISGRERAEVRAGGLRQAGGDHAAAHGGTRLHPGMPDQQFNLHN